MIRRSGKFGNGNVKWREVLLLAPVAILLLLAFILPLLAILPEAFSGNATGRIAHIFGDSVYRTLIWTTVRISLEATAITLAVSFPLAWILSRSTGLKAMLLWLLVLVPFLTSVMVRTFAWLAILGQKGLINGTLLGLGLISQPLPLLFGEMAVVLALVQCSIPMMVFALVTVLRRIDGRILLAAQTLGAQQVRIWIGVLVPLAVRGIQSGVAIIFLFTMATFVAPSFLGSQRQQMLAQVVQQEIEHGSDWALAAALGITLALVGTIMVAALSAIARHFSRWQRPGTPPSASTRQQTTPTDKSILRRPIQLRPPRFAIPAAVRIRPQRLELFYLALISLFILLPLVVLIPVAFSSAEALVFPPPGYSLRWFRTIYDSPDWTEAAITSLRIGAATCAATLVIATMTVIGIGRDFRYQGVAEAVLLSPLTVPSVVFALGAYLAFSRVGLVDTELGIIIAHTVLVFPIIYQVVSATFSSIDPRLSLAAASLGADRWRIFQTVVFPLLVPGLAIGALLSVLLSFDESTASVFLSNLSVKTLPRKLWEGIRFNTSPEAAAVSVVLLGVTCAVIFIGAFFLLSRRKNSLLPIQAQKPV
jgi:putative spermidine/putrescine transport system permease protein